MTPDEQAALAHARALLADAATILGTQARLIEGLSHTLRLCSGSIPAQVAVLLCAADLFAAVGRLHEARGADAAFLDRCRNEGKRLMTAAATLAVSEQKIITMPAKASA